MSLNVRYDNPSDAPHDWASRRDSLARFVLGRGLDLIGMQEVLLNQLEDLRAKLTDFVVVGVGRLDGKEAGEYAAIWFRRERFDLIENGHFWLSETPEVPGSIGWDAACERILTWAKLYDKRSRDTLLVANTHLDHVGEQSRVASAGLIRTRLSSIGRDLPLILMGDFNAPATDVCYALLRGDSDPSLSPLRDTRFEAKAPQGDAATFHNFGRIPSSERQRIDYILVNAPFVVLSQEHLSTEGEAYCLSDHDAVVSTLRVADLPLSKPIPSKP